MKYTSAFPDINEKGSAVLDGGEEKLTPVEITIEKHFYYQVCLLGFFNERVSTYRHI